MRDGIIPWRFAKKMTDGSFHDEERKEDGMTPRPRLSEGDVLVIEF